MHLLIFGGILFLFVIVKWKDGICVIVRPFDEMVGHIKATIIVSTIFEIDNYQFGIITDITLRIATKYRVPGIVQITVIVIINAKRTFSVGRDSNNQIIK